MPRILFHYSFLLFFVTSCGGGSHKEIVQTETNNLSVKDMKTQSAEIEAQEPEAQRIEDIKDLPSIYWGTWTNEGELSTLEIKDDGNCELEQDNPEEESIQIKGKWESTEKGIKITWNQPYKTQKIIEYRFEQTDSQKLLFQVINGQATMAFYQNL